MYTIYNMIMTLYKLLAFLTFQTCTYQSALIQGLNICIIYCTYCICAHVIQYTQQTHEFLGWPCNCSKIDLCISRGHQVGTNILHACHSLNKATELLVILLQHVLYVLLFDCISISMHRHACIHSLESLRKHFQTQGVQN